jgi:hypothetical protein
MDGKRSKEEDNNTEKMKDSNQHLQARQECDQLFKVDISQYDRPS